MSIVFAVEGESVSQGSLTAVPTNRNWRTVPGVRWTIKDAKPALKPWRKKVADAAAEEFGDRQLLEGPVCVWARFIFERPKAHFGTGKNAGVLKAGMPIHVVSHQKGDLDKHLRSILDALTGIVFNDDCQVAEVHSLKVYGAKSSCIIGVNPLKE
jgi:Holliday junction resolvase RusA-like endonuclease